MLVNNCKLGYKTASSGTAYTWMKGLRSLPDIGGDPNKVDHSSVDDEYKQYELGQKDAGDLAFTFRYRSSDEVDQFFDMVDKESSGNTYYWCLQFSDGMTVEFAGDVSVKLLTSGEVDTVVDWQLSIGLASDFTFTQPSSGGGGGKG